MGCYVNTLPLRITLPSSLSFRKAIRQVNEELLQALEHAELPFHRIVHGLNPSRSGGHNPFFQTVAQLLPRPFGDEVVEDLTLRWMRDLSGSSVAVDLWLNLEERTDGSFGGFLTYDTALFREASARWLVAQFSIMLRQAVGAPDNGTGSLRGEFGHTPPELGGGGLPHRRIQSIRIAGKEVSPFEVEETLRFSAIAALDHIAFAMPRQTLDTVIGVAVVQRQGHCTALRELREAIRASCGATCRPEWLPEMLAYVDAMPVEPTGKPIRAGLAAHLGVASLPNKCSTRIEKRSSDSHFIARPAADSLSRTSCAHQRSYEETPTHLLDLVLECVHMHTRNQHVAATTPLIDAGFNSMSAVQLANQLECHVGVELPPILLFQYSTADAIARHLHAKLAPAPGEQACQHVGTGSRAVCRHKVRLAGMAARWPAGSSSAYDLATLAGTAYDAVEQVPTTRWLVGSTAARHPAVRFMAHVPMAEWFDGVSFGISPAEALWMDPQQRLLLEQGYATLHDAGRCRSAMVASEVVVSVGIQATDFATIVMQTPTELVVYAASGFTFSVAAGRLSYVLGMHGACYSTDTACSTALVAAHTAAAMVRDSECESALTLSINLMLLPLCHELVAIAGMISADGRCKFLDSRSNGYVRSEGIGAVLLDSKLPEGKASLRSSAVGSDGKSASLTAPNGQAQVRLLLAAMQSGALASNHVQAVECHGTGTALGDPVETWALHEALVPKALAGMKANLGHMEPSAGMGGLLKLCTSLAAASVAPNAQLRALNLHVGSGLRGRACAMPTQFSRVATHREQEALQVGGVSSFGFSGTIAHTVLLHTRGGNGPQAIPPSMYRRHTLPWCDPPHPFVQHCLTSGERSLIWPLIFHEGLALEPKVIFRSRAAGSLHALVAGHVLQGRIIFPGAGYLEMMRAAGSVSLHTVDFLKPLAVESPGLLVESAVFESHTEVRSRTPSSTGIVTMLHCSGVVATGSTWRNLDHSWLHIPTRAADVVALFDGFNAVGLQYGPTYRTLVQAWGGTRGASACLRPRSTQEGTQVHPADLDDALCTAAASASEGGRYLRLPFAVDDALLQGAPGEMWAVSAHGSWPLSGNVHYTDRSFALPARMLAGCRPTYCQHCLGAARSIASVRWPHLAASGST